MAAGLKVANATPNRRRSTGFSIPSFLDFSTVIPGAAAPGRALGAEPGHDEWEVPARQAIRQSTEISANAPSNPPCLLGKAAWLCGQARQGDRIEEKA